VPIPNSKGNPFSRGIKYMVRVGKIGDLSLKQYEIGRWLLLNVNRKSWVPDQTVSFPMTRSDPNPSFKVTVYLQVEYLTNGAS